MRIEAVLSLGGLCLLFGCTQPAGPTASSVETPAQLLLADTFPPASESGSPSGYEDVAAFISGFREAHETDSFEDLLASDFRYLATDGKTQARVQPRDSFIRSRQLMFGSGHAPAIRTNVRAVEMDGNTVTLQMVQQYRGRVFAPVLGEKFRLRRSGALWMADLMASAPVFTYSDGQPVISPAGVFVLKGDAELSSAIDSQKGFEAYLERQGVEAFEALLIENNRNSITGDETPYSVVFAFETPPRPGSKIRIEHQFWRPWAQDLPPYVFRFYAEGTAPYAIYTNTSQAGGSGGTITYRIFVDDQLVGKKEVRIL